MTALLSAEKIRKEFYRGWIRRPLREAFITSKRTASTQVLFDDVTISIDEGQSIALLGANGSGKTTLLKILSGILTPTSGIVIGGNESIPLLSTDGIWFEDASIRDSTRLLRAFFGTPSEVSSEAILEDSELYDRCDEPVRHLSRGMRARLLLSAALLSKPSVLLLDEIFSSLDSEHLALYRKKLLEFRHKGGGVLFVSHDRSLMEGDADCAYRIMNGHLIEERALRTDR